MAVRGPSRRQRDAGGAAQRLERARGRAPARGLCTHARRRRGSAEAARRASSSSLAGAAMPPPSARVLAVPPVALLAAPPCRRRLPPPRGAMARRRSSVTRLPATRPSSTAARLPSGRTRASQRAAAAAVAAGRGAVGPAGRDGDSAPLPCPGAMATLSASAVRLRQVQRAARQARGGRRGFRRLRERGINAGPNHSGGTVHALGMADGEASAAFQYAVEDSLQRNRPLSRTGGRSVPSADSLKN